MYTVERPNDEVIVLGPEGFKKRLPGGAVGIALRFLTDSDEPTACTVFCRDMSDAEAVACALGLVAAP